MTVQAVFLALLLHGQAPQTQDPKVFHLGPETVNLKFPQPAQDSAPPASLVSWSGWTGIAGPRPKFDSPFQAAGDWSGVEKAYLSNANAPGIVWRTKIVILANVDALQNAGSRGLYDHRNSLTGDRFIETLDSIPQFIALVSAATAGKVRIVPDVLIDPEPSRDEATPESPAFSANYLRDYLAPRINGGLYEADDKIYRGPYNSVIFIDPCARFTQRAGAPSDTYLSKVFDINGIPSIEVPFDASGGGSTQGALALAIFTGWQSTVAERAKEKALPPLAGALDSQDWNSIAELNEPSTDKLLARFAAGQSKSPILPVLQPDGLFSPTYKTSNIALAIVKDPTKGDALRYSEAKSTRFGGFVLPNGSSPIDASKSPSLSFWIKTGSGQPIALRFEDQSHKASWVSLGRDPIVLEPGLSKGLALTTGAALAESPRLVELPLQADGAWHRVTIDLRALGLGAITQIRVGASPSASQLTTDVSEPIAYEFADFELSQEAATPLLTDPSPDSGSTDPAARIAAAADFGKKGQPSQQLFALLQDPDPGVVLNAAAAYQNIVDPAAELKLIDVSQSANPRTAEFALKALAHQGSQTAKDALEHSVRSGFEYSREVAAHLLGAQHDPKVAEDLMPLVAGQNWHTRLASVESLGEVPGETAAVMRLAILQQEDPVIKLAVIKFADPNGDREKSKLEWSAVNESSDMVRAAAAIKLIQAKDPATQVEGFKVVRDDSYWTRKLLLDYLAAHPIEAARGTERLALTDRSAIVRASALDALAALPKVELEDVQAALNDQNPEVQIALLRLAKKQMLQLPEKTLAAMRTSPDPQVVAKVQG